MADKKQKKQSVESLEDLRKLDVKELQSKVAELKKELVEQQRSHAAQELPSSAVIGKTRKQIARALTLLNEKAVSEQPATPEKKEEEK